MNIIKYRPTTKSLLDWDWDNLFGDFFNQNQNSWHNTWIQESHHYPAVDVKEEEAQYLLETDLPGFADKDIDIKVEDNLLTISSKKGEDKVQNDKGYLIKERQNCAFTRSFVLPRDVDKDKIEANFKDGVLTLKLSKQPDAKPRQIEIKS